MEVQSGLQNNSNSVDQDWRRLDDMNGSRFLVRHQSEQQPTSRNASDRVLVIVREFTEGGAAFLALRHMRRLADARQVDLLVCGAYSTSMLSRLPGGIGVERIAGRISADGQDLLAMRLALADLNLCCLSNHYDTVLGCSLFPDMAACAAFSLSWGRQKIVMLVDEGLLEPRLSRHTGAAMQGALLAADHLLPVSQALLSKLARVHPLMLRIPATVLHPPIEPKQALNQPSPFTPGPQGNAVRVVTVARLSAEKQLETCLKIHRRLRHKGIDFHWHILGEGQQHRRLNAMAALLGMSDRFHLEGFQEDPRLWMRHADLFVLCSRSEGCPTVIREALAEGTPVLSTDVNGARELIEHNVTGIVVANSADQIEKSLGRLVKDQAMREQLRQGIAARQAIAAPESERDQLLTVLAKGARSRCEPSVSILIPTYNQEAWIGTAIHSALMQDYADLEVIVCDDASTDATLRAAQTLSHDRRLNIHSNALNRGRVANYRRLLLKEARGRWVLMLDGDDYLCNPSFISEALQDLALNESEQPVFVQAGHRVVWRSGAGTSDRRCKSVDVLPAIQGRAKRIPGASYLLFVFQTGFFTHLGTLYQREAAIRHQFYSQDISSSDMESLLRLALTGDVVLRRSIAGCWVQHERNASSNLPLERIEENVKIFRKIAKTAASAGLLGTRSIEPSLTRYEARLMATMFTATVGRSATRMADAFAMLTIISSVNDRAFWEPGLMIAWCLCLLRLSLRSLQRLLADRIHGRWPQGGSRQ